MTLQRVPNWVSLPYINMMSENQGLLESRHPICLTCSGPEMIAHTTTACKWNNLSSLNWLAGEKKSLKVCFFSASSGSLDTKRGAKNNIYTNGSLFLEEARLKHRCVYVGVCQSLLLDLNSVLSRQGVSLILSIPPSLPLRLTICVYLVNLIRKTENPGESLAHLCMCANCKHTTPGDVVEELVNQVQKTTVHFSNVPELLDCLWHPFLAAWRSHMQPATTTKKDLWEHGLA